MHGTGTQAGDGTEMRSVTDVFAPNHSRRSDDEPLYVGAAKANIGHGEASSGVVSLIKAMLVLKHSRIPPHVGIKGKINAGFPDLEALNVRIAFQSAAFPRKNGKKRTILVNNFSAAGQYKLVQVLTQPKWLTLPFRWQYCVADSGAPGVSSCSSRRTSQALPGHYFWAHNNGFA